VESGYRRTVGYSYAGVDLREHPEEYRIGRGEQGVFHAEPYKSELLPLWKFKDEEAARESSEAIYQKFLEYRSGGDFVGMDVARKYLEMGWTRSLCGTQSTRAARRANLWRSRIKRSCAARPSSKSFMTAQELTTDTSR
jgi:hypothetical protein